MVDPKPRRHLATRRHQIKPAHETMSMTRAPERAHWLSRVKANAAEGRACLPIRQPPITMTCARQNGSGNMDFQRGVECVSITPNGSATSIRTITRESAKRLKRAYERPRLGSSALRTNHCAADMRGGARSGAGARPARQGRESIASPCMDRCRGQLQQAVRTSSGPVRLSRVKAQPAMVEENGHMLPSTWLQRKVMRLCGSARRARHVDMGDANGIAPQRAFTRESPLQSPRSIQASASSRGWTWPGSVALAKVGGPIM